MRAFPSWSPMLSALIAIVAAFLVAAALIWYARRRIVRAVASLDLINDEDRRAVLARARQMVAALTVGVYGIAALVSLSLLLRWLGFRSAPFHPSFLLDWLLTSGVRILAIAFVSFLVVRASRLVIEHLKLKGSRTEGALDGERLKRTATVSALASRAVTVAVFVMASLMILRELSVDIMPILTGAGIVGLAIGFGAQSLVKDVISGFFLILDNQVRVGDVARIGGVQGLVEEINLRTLVLRDIEGVVHVFPNGSIQTLANLTKNYSYALVDVAVPAVADVDEVMKILREVGDEIRADPDHEPHILEPLEVFGVESLEGAKMQIRARVKTVPLKQWDVARELRRRAKNALQTRGIRVV